MLEFLRFGGSSERRIALQTRLASPIPNSQAPEPDSQSIAVFQRLLSKHPGWSLRKPPCGIYNCAGQVWASRRTAIYEQEWYERILQDDGYRRLGVGEEPSHTDLAIYLMTDTGNILHVGIVTELRQLVQFGTSRSSQEIPWILSKWNDASGEVLHHFNDVPYEKNVWEVCFWTDRP